MTCQDKHVNKDATEAFKGWMVDFVNQYFSTKFCDYTSRQVVISEGCMHQGHWMAVAMHMFEAGMEVGHLFEKAGGYTFVGDTVRDGQIDAEFADGSSQTNATRNLAGGDPPTWMDETYRSAFCEEFVKVLWRMAEKRSPANPADEEE